MAWSLIGVSTVAEDATGNFTLNAPAGTPTIGDLLIACIGFRSNVAVSPPAGEGWNLVATQQLSGDTDATSGIASGGMWYKVLTTASDGSMAWTRTAGGVLQGTILRYRGVDAANPYRTGNAATLGSLGEPSAASLALTANDLIVYMVSSGDENSVGAFDAVTDPATASGTSPDTATAPTVGTWILRFNVTTGTNPDHGLAVADAVKTDTAATGTMSAVDATGTTRSASIVGAFIMDASVPKALADSGSGADVQTIASTVAVADSGSGVDAQTITATLPLADSGSGADALSVSEQQDKALSDSGSGIDVQTIQAAEALADSGSGADAVFLAAGDALSDQGSGADQLGAAATLAVADQGSGADAVALAVTVALSDSGGGVDALSKSEEGGTTPEIGDGGSGSEGVGIAGTLAIADAGSGTDALGLQSMLGPSDSGTGQDVVGISSQVALQDAGGGTDALSVDEGGGSKAMSEGGSGADLQEIAATLSLADTGGGQDAQTVAADPGMADSGTGTDAMTIVIVYGGFIEESGVGVDVLAVLVVGPPTAAARYGFSLARIYKVTREIYARKSIVFRLSDFRRMKKP